MYNMDEKGFMMGKGERCKVICRRGRKNGKVTNAGCREWVTVIEAVTASGIVLPPMLINKGEAHYKRSYAALRKGARATFSYTKKGWTNQELRVEWLEKSFEPAIVERYVLQSY